MCNSSHFLIDEDYQMCYGCYLYYEANNPIVLKDFEQGLITKNKKKSNLCINCDGQTTLSTNDTHVYLVGGCSNGQKNLMTQKTLEYYKKLYFNRKYHLEEYIIKF